GLARWVDFGAEAYRRDLAGQAAYFALGTEDSRAVLERERRGTLFVDCQRRLNLYLRAFWARDFFLRPASAQDAGFRPYADGGAIHLPDAVDDLPGVAGLDVYRAMVAHLAAHVVHSRAALSPEGLSPAQQFLVGVFEDARVEHCAIRAFPGLKRLWQRLLPDPSAGPRDEASVVLLERTALALLDGAAFTGDDAVDALVRRFRERIEADCEDAMASLVLGLELFHLLEARGPLPSLRVLEGLRIPYRDDNRIVWQGAVLDGFHEAAWQLAGPRQTRRRVSLMEFVNGLDVETAGDDAQEVWVLDGVLYDDDGVTWNEREGREPVSEPRHYPEWDYRVQRYRPDWATVYERCAPRGDAGRIDRILAARKPLVSRIRRIVDRLRPQGVVRERKLEDGDELDLDAAVDAAVALRSGRQPDLRIAMRSRLRHRDLAVLVLLDLSESTNETVQGGSQTVLDLTREACALVSTAIAGIGDPFAVHGFSSDGRHDVRYVRFKDFDQHFDGEVKARLAGMQGGLSTRMGAAMRHAATHLAQLPARRKLLLVVTDGEPADIDERDPQTLRHDARKAVEALHAQGIESYCLTLDARADQYVERSFGADRYTIVDHVERLPERLPQLFASLTR
ncbi:MAG TPA: VWA domain-containing protein, partial [Rhodocyclaceae bacterium]|nr:VWA domain-containing protein [Rhodocyclaceae bacterium]